MFKLKSLLLLAVMTPVTAVCQSSPTMPSEIDTSIDFTDLNRSDFVDAATDLMMANWKPSFELFRRLDPSVAAVIPEYQKDAEFREINACIYDQLSSQGALADMNIVRDNAITSWDYIHAHPELNVATIGDHDSYLDAAIPPDAYLGASQDCGLFAIMTTIMTDSGVTTAMQELAKNAQ